MLDEYEPDESEPEASANDKAIKGDKVVKRINKQHALIQYGNRMLIMCEITDPILKRPALAFLSASDFRLKYANKFIDVPNGEEGTKKISWANYWLRSSKRREYQGIVFAPDQTPKGYYNIWRGFVVEPKAGSCTLMKRHMREVLCAKNNAKFDYLWKWCAHAVQRPGERAETAIVMRSKQGTGKNTFVDAFGSIFGRHYVPLTQTGLLCGRFTAHLMDAVIVFANEATWGGDKAGEGKLKSMITDPVETIEAKGKDAIPVPNFKRIIVGSNEDWAVPRGIGDRRFFCLDVPPHRVGDTQYFTALRDEINNGGVAALLHELLETDLTDWHPRHSMPVNTDGEDMKLESMSSTLKFWHECLEFGRNFPYDPDNPSAPAWHQTLSTELFYNFYLDWCTRHRISHMQGPSHFGIQFRKAVDVKKVRPTGEYNSKLPPVYELPDLDECRAQFKTRIAHVEFD